MALPRLSDVDTCLDGQWVRATLPGGDVCAPGRDFTFVTRGSDDFEALMVYFHLDRAQAYIQSLGFTNVLNRQLRANADDLSDDNSYYDQITKELYFGTGGVDDAEDADVIVHEYGHAIQDAQVPGFGAGNEAGAMGEGWGDYLQATISATYTPNPTFDPCFAEWDGLGATTPEDCLRRTDTGVTVQQQLSAPCSAEIHCLGEAWSGALWDIRGALGGPDTDRLVIQSHFSLPFNATFQDGSRALLAADQALYGGVHEVFLRNLLSSRGLLDLERLDDVPAEAVPIGVPARTAGQLDVSRDPHDVYSIALTVGQGIEVHLTGDPDFDLRLYGTGTSNLADGVVVAASATPGTSTEAFSYVPSVSGTYYLDVSAAGGAGAYALETVRDLDADSFTDPVDNCPAAANPGQEDRDRDGRGDVCDAFPDDPANDADHDGRGASTDNCPRVANPSQADWNANGRGDACDRSARVTLGRSRPPAGHGDPSRDRPAGGGSGERLAHACQPSNVRAGGMPVRLPVRAVRCEVARPRTAPARARAPPAWSLRVPGDPARPSVRAGEELSGRIRNPLSVSGRVGTAVGAC